MCGLAWAGLFVRRSWLHRLASYVCFFQASQISVDDQHSSVTVNVAEDGTCSPESTPTVSSPSIPSSHCSLPSVNPSPLANRLPLSMEQQPALTSKSEPATPAKTAYSSADRNHVTVVPCPSPPSGILRFLKNF